MDVWDVDVGKPLFFLGFVFGKLRHLGVSLSLFGQPLGIGSSREIT